MKCVPGRFLRVITISHLQKYLEELIENGSPKFLFRLHNLRKQNCELWVPPSSKNPILLYNHVAWAFWENIWSSNLSKYRIIGSSSSGSFSPSASLSFLLLTLLTPFQCLLKRKLIICSGVFSPIRICSRWNHRRLLKDNWSASTKFLFSVFLACQFFAQNSHLQNFGFRLI